MMITILQVGMALVFAYFAFGVLYQLFYAVLGLFYQVPLVKLQKDLPRILVLIPGYKEDAVIVETAKAAVAHQYAGATYEPIIIADSFEQHTLDALAAIPIRVEEVAFEKSTKSKALNTVLRRLSVDAYDLLVILDADNIMEVGFLDRIASHYQAGYRAIQGQRAAKNLDTPMAVLDGASEAINNHIVSKGPQVLGLSARLAGSGMAFDYTLFRQVMPQVDAIGGFDKELELRLTQAGERIFYDDTAIVLDEKVRRGGDFSRQRSRWMAAQFHYAKHFLPTAIRNFVTKGNIDFLNKSLQMILPPRLLTPGVLGLFCLASLLLGAWSWAVAWGFLLLANITCFLVAMPRFVWQDPHRQALFQLPMAFGQALLSLTRLKAAQGKFINTPHGTKD